MRFRRLRSDEMALAQAVFDLHAELGSWPSFGAVERALVRDMDVGEVSREMSRRLGVFLSSPQWNDLMVLPPWLAAKCAGVDEAYAPLVRALPVISEVYFSAVEKPEIRDTDFRERGWSATEVERLGRLLRCFSPFLGSGGYGGGHWHYEIYPSIKTYARASSGRELMETWVRERGGPPKRRDLKRGLGQIRLGDSPRRFAWVGHVLTGAAGIVLAALVLYFVFGLGP